MKICYMEKKDHDFIRWTSNLLRTFIDEGSISIVDRSERPDLMVASVWRKHRFPLGVPVILISNENWNLFRPHAPLQKYLAVLGLYPPDEPCTFVQYPFGAVHFDVPVDELYELRKELLEIKKTRFCCFVASSMCGDLGPKRVDLFEEINQWKHVDSGGAMRNNMDFRPPRGLDYLRWIAQYKYMICLENSTNPGYITEKPFQAWFAGTVPIYDGGCVAQLNQEAIINVSEGNVLEELARLEESQDRYEAKRRAPLTDARLSLVPFEQRFRTMVLDPITQELASDSKGWRRSCGELLRFCLPW